MSEEVFLVERESVGEEQQGILPGVFHARCAKVLRSPVKPCADDHVRAFLRCRPPPGVVPAGPPPGGHGGPPLRKPSPFSSFRFLGIHELDPEGLRRLEDALIAIELAEDDALDARGGQELETAPAG